MLEESLKAMLTSLPLVQELHHSAMRERHWQQLMSVSPDGPGILRDFSCVCMPDRGFGIR